MLDCLPHAPGAYQLPPGAAHSGLCINVASQAEATKKLETEIEKLLGPQW
ncbi:hypothetical protein [Stenotrophomonas maltophilia]|nr:hypothetical protein [Stenotrophomonas maltophilia]